MEVARTATIMVVSILAPWLLQWIDRRRMPLDQRARTWNAATWGASLYAFGPLSMMGWVFVTRPPWRRIWLAGPATVAAVIPLVAVDLAFDAAIDGARERPSAVDLAGELVVVGIVAVVLTALIEGVVRLARRLRGLPAPRRRAT